jgi:3-phenylpropionate/trans-cinnamate dioxygenase ferredoxin reductase subunit
VEHWATALHSGPAAARSMLGTDARYDRLPYFYTDQYELGMEYIGHAPPGGYDTVVVRGDLARREFVAFWTSGGRVLAGMGVNVWGIMDSIEALIRTGARVDLGRLADTDVALDDVTPASQACGRSVEANMHRAHRPAAGMPAANYPSDGLPIVGKGEGQTIRDP